MLQGTLQLIDQKMFGEERQIAFASILLSIQASVEVDVSASKWWRGNVK